MVSEGSNSRLNVSSILNAKYQKVDNILMLLVLRNEDAKESHNRSNIVLAVKSMSMLSTPQNPAFSLAKKIESKCRLQKISPVLTICPHVGQVPTVTAKTHQRPRIPWRS